MRSVYKKKIYFMLLIVFIIIFIGTGVKASAATKSIVGKDKIWVIKFNNPISYDDKAVGSITVLDKKGEKVNIRLEVSKDKKSIMVKPPVRMYNQGEDYTLNVERDIYSKYGKRLKERKTINFTIKKEEPFNDFVEVNNSEVIISETENKYIFFDMQELKGLDGSSLKENGWNYSVYKTINSDKAKSVIDAGDNPKPLVLPLTIKGWMGVYVGYVNNTEEFKINLNDKEHEFKNYNYNKDKLGDRFINEAFMFAHNFHEDDILNISSLEGKEAHIAYIKFVSLRDEQIALYNNNGNPLENRRTVIYDNDGYTDFFWGKYPDVAALQKFPKNVAFKLNGEINWTVGTTGLLTYNSLYAGPAFQGAEKFDPYVREGDILARQQILNILSKGKSPLEVVADTGQILGINVNASLRMNSFYSDQSTKFLNGSMYDYFTECLQNGSTRMSYYYARYRTYILNVLKEISVVPNVDGITLDFCRSPYLMGSEATQEEKIKIMNTFMRQVRKQIPNKKITVRFPYLNPSSYGLDIDTWIKEGLIDRVVPSAIGQEEYWNMDEYLPQYKSSKVEILIGISANLKGRDLTPETERLLKEGKYVPDNRYLSIEEYLFRANEAYNNGADGIFIFNILNDLDISEDISPKFKILKDKHKVKEWYEFEYEAYLVNDRIEWML